MAERCMVILGLVEVPSKAFQGVRKEKAFLEIIVLVECWDKGGEEVFDQFQMRLRHNRRQRGGGAGVNENEPLRVEMLLERSNSLPAWLPIDLVFFKVTVDDCPQQFRGIGWWNPDQRISGGIQRAEELRVQDFRKVQVGNIRTESLALLKVAHSEEEALTDKQSSEIDSIKDVLKEEMRRPII